MTPLFKRHHMIVITALALLVACSSGGESGTGFQQDQTTVGQITGFGSIFVNGIEFNTDQAAVQINGIDDDELNLAVGMVVTVKGSVNADGISGIASNVITQTEVEGLVFQNNVATDGTINVMGQTVHISNDTKFKSSFTGISVVADLVAGDSVVEVNGYSNSQGDIYATYVKVVETNTGGMASEVKLHGIVTDPTGTEASGSFRIGAIDINFADDATTQFIGLTRNQLLTEANLYVSVEGNNYTDGSPVTASEIKKQDVNNESEGEELEVEGVVTDVTTLGTDAGQFALNGRIVRYDSNTQFDGGNTSDIATGVKLEVEGAVQADSSILAHDISLRDESDMEIAGTVTAIGDNSLQITDDAQTSTLTVIVNQYTSYEDEVDSSNRYFNFNDITQDMHIEVKYYVDPDTGNVATSIKKTTMN